MLRLVLFVMLWAVGATAAEAQGAGSNWGVFDRIKGQTFVSSVTFGSYYTMSYVEEGGRLFMITRWSYGTSTRTEIGADGSVTPTDGAPTPIRQSYEIRQSGWIARDTSGSTTFYRLEPGGDISFAATMLWDGKPGYYAGRIAKVGADLPRDQARAETLYFSDPGQSAISKARYDQIAANVDAYLGPRPSDMRYAAPAAPPPSAPAVATPAIAGTLSGPRIALVVGNAAYGANMGALANPVNDARTVAAALAATGFQVETILNTDQRTLKQAIARLGQRLGAAGRGATGLFYYAGHGVQSRGTNYLVPVNAALETEADVDLDAVPADAVLSQMEEAGAKTSIVILDACRNMPLVRSFRSGTRGLARMDAPNGSFVAYSTAPGAVAADGSGANSPFASALAAEVRKPGQPIEIVFRNVRRAVSTATEGRQTPWDSSSLLDSFMFSPER